MVTPNEYLDTPLLYYNDRIHRKRWLEYLTPDLTPDLTTNGPHSLRHRRRFEVATTTSPHGQFDLRDLKQQCYLRVYCRLYFFFTRFDQAHFIRLRIVLGDKTPDVKYPLHVIRGAMAGEEENNGKSRRGRML